MNLKTNSNKYIAFFEKLFKHKSENFIIQLFRNGISSTIAFSIDFSFLFILTKYFSIHYLIAGAICYILGHTVNYIINITWVFSKRRYNKKSIEFAIFFLLGTAGLGLTELFLWVFTDILHFHYLTSKLISIVSIFMVNFLLKKHFLFQTNENE